ncbi:MAG: hypothetical protein Q4E57_03805 [Eubacteriales bacterium]|nr:hypothetical protein [Eubacteriales bacterium]
MINRALKLLGATAMMSAMLSTASFAATAITSVNFNYTIEDDAAIKSGYNEPLIEVADSAIYEVGDISCTSDISSATGKTALSYTLTLTAKRNYYFPDAGSINVSGSGITELTKKTTSSSDNTILTVKFKAYPYFQVAAPSYVTAFDSIKGSKSNTETAGRETTLTIDKNGASKIEYVISYVDQDGESRSKSGTTTGSTISVSTYNKQYTGSSTSKHSCYIRGIAIRAAASLGSNANAAPSEWVYIDGGLSRIDTEEYFTTYTSWDDLKTGSSTGTASSSATGTTYAGTTYSGSNVNVFGWSGSGDTWYYYSNGVKVTGWLFDGSNWYFCDQTGLMKTGWVQDGGLWYYLNPAHDGTFGCMKTGWVDYSGARYYLNPNAGGPMGSMVTGTVNIGGRNYNFASSGALIG